MNHLKTFENYLTKKYQREKDYDEYLWFWRQILCMYKMRQ